MVKTESQKPNRAETKETRRKLIVETAALCFVEKGFHQTSIRDIANKAGISLGNVYNHFENKAALIGEIAQLEAEDLSELFAKTDRIGSPAKALDKFASLYLAYCCKPENSMLSAEIIAEGLRNPDIGEGFHINRKALVEYVVNLIGRVRLQQRETAKLSANDASEFILDLIEGLAMRSAFLARKPSSKSSHALNAAIHAIVSDSV
ncbi:MAG: TetR/AcrR family transcriptional regulator [Hyphomicrobiales bacterium]